MRLYIAAAAVLAITQSACLAEPDIALDEILAENSLAFEIGRDGLDGAGAEKLLSAAEQAQFVALGEQHNRAWIPGFTTALFADLQDRYDFQYLALEQGAAVMKRVSSAPMRGDRGAIEDVARRFPRAFTFVSDQELSMLAQISAASKATSEPIWGCELPRGVLHILEEIAASTDRESLPENFDFLIERARSIEADRHEGEFLSAPEILAAAHALEASQTNDRTKFLARQIVAAAEYAAYYDNGEAGLIPGHFAGNELRENAMRTLCRDAISRAVERDGKPPRVLIKHGHVHLHRGLYLNSVSSLGAYLEAEAQKNDAEFVSVYMLGFNSSVEAMAADEDWLLLHPFAPFLDPKEPTLIDLRPLREYPVFRALRASPPFTNAGDAAQSATSLLRDIIYNYDFLAVAPNAGKADFDVAQTEF